MECEGKSDQAAVDEFETLQTIVDQLRLANYGNEQGYLVCNVAFHKLEELAKKEQQKLSPLYSKADDTDSTVAAGEYPQESFHIEAEIYEGDELINLLVVPFNEVFVVVSANEHLCTLVRSCEAADCWEQQDGGLEQETVERIGEEISRYISSFY